MTRWITLLLIPTLSFSHPGPTDSRGGHWDNSTGGHHYHNKTPYVPPKLNASSSKDENKINPWSNSEKNSHKEKIIDKKLKFLF